MNSILSNQRVGEIESTSIRVRAWWFLVPLAAITGIWAWPYAIGKMPKLVTWRWLEVQEIKITSDWPLLPSTVEGWLPQLKGRNLFQLNAKEILSNIRAKSWVETAVVRKEYPDRIRIDVVTKRPRAILVRKGVAHWVDAEGGLIEKVSSPLLKGMDLPIISEESRDLSEWNLSQVVSLVHEFHEKIPESYSISQTLLQSYPFFKVFFATPVVEATLSMENWESQIPYLVKLLNNPPRLIGQLRKINLVISKKAVVSASLSN